MKLRVGLLPILLFFAGCSIDIGGGSQLAGQRCFQESDCAEGLTCYERVCTPEVGGAVDPDPDAGGNNANNNNPVNNAVDAGPPVPPLPTDAGPAGCELGDRRCVGTRSYEICVDVEGVPAYQLTECGRSEVCFDGRCVQAPMCEDADGDGYGIGCPLGEDCDDLNPDRNPGLRERCGTPFDDNCDGRRNEGCEPGGECCPNGCGADQFCSAQCVCTDYDPDICEFQNQPCDEEGQFVNGFFCAALDDNSSPRCFGVCDVNAPDPNDTCPEPGTVCAFDSGDSNNGLCLAPCDINVPGSCGEPDFGCLAADVSPDSSGICTPINPDNDLSQPCDPDSFFDCDEGLVCVSLGGGFRGRCRQGCRPFVWGGMGTDCGNGNCVAFSPSFGICTGNNNSTEGESCNPPLSSCQQDAVSCYPAGMGQGNQCLRICRLEEGDIDCLGGGACTQFDPDQPDLGICF